MSIRYEVVEWEDLGYNFSRPLPYPSTETIAGAGSNSGSAGTFVVAVENDVRRSLTEAGDSDLKSACRDHHMNRMKPRAAQLPKRRV